MKYNRCIFISFLMLVAGRAWAASPAICYAISNVSTLADWTTNPGAANHWASSSGGAAGSCGASGGTGLAVPGSSAVTLPAGVPGASGAADIIIVNTGVEVDVPATVGVDLGGASEANGAAFTLNATNSTTYGVLAVQQNGLLRIAGNGSSNPLGAINQYAVFQIMPNGYLRLGHNSGSPVLNNYGRFYIGCDDQTVNATVKCTDNAASIVTASVGSTLNFTATGTLSTLFKVGDLVTVNIPQQPYGTYPYATETGQPPNPPVMPTTNDTGTSPMKTCGANATCIVPEGYLLCIVAISGNSVTLGWAHGGTPLQPACDGNETAIAITGAGSGSLYLTKITFAGGLPTDYTWNNSASYSPSDFIGKTDPYTSVLPIPGAPISNAAGTGPGRPGDNSLSLSLTLPSTITSCAALTIVATQTAGCFVNYDHGELWQNGTTINGIAFTGTLTYDTPSAVVAVNGAVSIPAGTRTYNEMVIANSYITYLYGGSDQGFFQFSNLDNSTNRHLAFRQNVVRMSDYVLGIDGTTAASSTTPIQVTQWSIYAHNNTATAPTFTANNSSQYVDFSAGKFDDYHRLLDCAVSSNAAFVNLANFALTNIFFTGELIGVSYTTSCNFPDLLVQDFRMQGAGTNDGVVTGWPYSFFASFFCSNSAAHPAVFQYNLIYGAFRGFEPCSNQIVAYNAMLYQWHHFSATTDVDSGGAGGYISNVLQHHNIQHQFGSVQGMDCADAGYNQASYMDVWKFYNNTCINTFGGQLIGDPDAQQVSALVGMESFNNIYANMSAAFSPGPYAMYKERSNPQIPIMIQAQHLNFGFNASFNAGNTVIPYGNMSDSNNNIPNPSYYRNVQPTWQGTQYNKSPSRNATGIAIQNPNYSTPVNAGAFKLTITSSSNITAQWAADGATYGTASQLNWGGAGQTYTLASVTDPGATHEYLTITTTGTPFIAYNLRSSIATPTGCPVARWARMLTGANAGQAYMIMGCSGTNSAATNALVFSPRITGIAGGDTFAVFNLETNVPDAASGSIDVGLDARLLPSSNGTYTDTGIALVFTDYSATVTGTLPGLYGLSASYTKMPSAGGNARDVFASGTYLPSGAGWKIQGSGGTYLGAIAPAAQTAPTTIVP